MTENEELPNPPGKALPDWLKRRLADRYGPRWYEMPADDEEQGEYIVQSRDNRDLAHETHQGVWLTEGRFSSLEAARKFISQSMQNPKYELMKIYQDTGEEWQFIEETSRSELNGG